jgi:hypothetical protein
VDIKINLKNMFDEIKEANEELDAIANEEVEEEEEELTEE